MKKTTCVTLIISSIIIVLCFWTNALSDTFTDDFSTAPTTGTGPDDYTVVNTWTQGGTGAFLYDSSGQRLRVNTGDDVGLAFSHSLPPLDTGVFQIDFRPLVKYPSGGLINLWLRASDGSYYQVSSSDGYGAGGISKYVGGLKVDTAAFSSGYTQGRDYTITIYFSPTGTTVEAFGQVLAMDTDSTVVTVSSVEVELAQQDAYFDNIAYSLPDMTAPVWDDTVGICSAVDTAVGGNVRVDFGTATDDVSGSNVSYNIYYAPTAGWSDSDWSVNYVILDVVPAAGTVCANAYTVGGLISGTEYTFGVRVADESGNEDTNQAAITARPTGDVPASFTDDFSTAPTTGTGPDDYTVVNTWTQGGTGAFLYDSSGQRLRVNTGDDVGLAFSHSLPPLDTGVFQIDFRPLVKYPSGGLINLWLRASDGSYYQVSSSDGYGAGGISKYVGGLKVDTAAFSSGYTQGRDYTITIYFSPTGTTVEAFGQVLAMDTDSTVVTVSSVEVELAQQDAYFDNIAYSLQDITAPDMTAPVWDDTVGICSAVDTAVGGNVRVDFGNATDDVSGSNVSYNIYYAPTAGWSDSDWSVNYVILDVVPAAGTVCANAYTVGGLVSGTEYTFGVRVADESGNEDTNQAAITAIPTGDVPASFTDDFSTAPTTGTGPDDYTVVNTWTQGGTGAFLYDSSGQRLRVNTGDNVGLAFSHSLPPLDTGVFQIDFRPLVKYPSGGLINLWLRASDGSYYQVSSSDGYGAGGISKYVGGLKVDTAAFSSGYTQGRDYTITIYFSPTGTTVEAFGQVLAMDTDSTVVTVSSVEVELAQQDAYFDNIAYSLQDITAPDMTAPVWDDTVGICSAVDTAVGGNVRVDFGTATDDVSGSNVSYNIYYAPTAGWSDSDWSVNYVILDVVPAAGTVCANAYTVGGLVSGTEYTFGVRVADESGNEDTNQAAITAIPTGDVPASFTDDFSTAPTTGTGPDDYTVVNTWTQGGTGAFLYDSSGQRLRVNTGDDVGLAFSHSLPPLDTGVFQIDFRPLVKYPSGGLINLWLRASDGSYYQVSSSDGYGAGGISKYVGGLKVDTAAFSSGYTQGRDYTITIYFSPTGTTVEAFGQVLAMDTDSTVVTVSSVEVELAQQDAYLDNILFLDDPFVSITYPQSSNMQSSIDLQVRAATGNLQSGWGVQFILEDNVTNEIQTSPPDYTAPFTYTFTGLNKSEHTLDAIIVDGGTPPTQILGEYASDTKDSVGIGDFYAAFGDSITFGVGDDIVADDISLDQRNSGGGYTPILNDLLTASKGYPHTVVNAGVGGEDSSEGLARVQNVIDAHPEAIYFLILFGTNDSDGTMPVPSGLVDDFLDPGDPGYGDLLEPGDSGYDGSFLDNMQQIVDVLVANGKTPFLAKVPIALGPCSTCTPFADPEAATRNRFIRNYNTVIAALISDNGLGVAPDFYDYFSTNQDQFSDNLHFTGAGYQSMAALWFDALTAP